MAASCVGVNSCRYVNFQGTRGLPKQFPALPARKPQLHPAWVRTIANMSTLNERERVRERVRE
eukprot:1160533-Pelagomonas_calceolata.AAC.19